MNSTLNATDIVVVGGGIVGLATALAVTERFPNAVVTVIEKEASLGLHQTGRNSGVIHSGIYYAPGSLKATLCRTGARQLEEYCSVKGVAYRTTGKLIVATSAEQVPGLQKLAERARAHGLEFTELGAQGIRDHEPNAIGHAALHVPSTGIVDYRGMLEALRADLLARGGQVQMSTKVDHIESVDDAVVVHTDHGNWTARAAINCGGLFSDRIAVRSKVDPGARIVPFRGEYYELAPEATNLVNALIYPVPDPSFPFLGVHLTKSLDGGVHAGPNAVLSLRREGYSRFSFDLRDAIDAVTYPGFLRLARRNLRPGLMEVARSFSKELFARSVQELVPAVEKRFLRRAEPGVRAQALTRQGSLVDDFLIVESGRTLHVCNSPSPAATASLAIGEAIAARVRL